MQHENKYKFNSYTMLEAAEFLSALGFSVIPVNYNKQPNVKEWKPFQKDIPNAFQISDMFIASTYGIAIICGNVSGNLEVLDEDLKYDLTGTMHEEFIALVKEQAPGLYERLVIQKTRSGGFHYLYRCEVIEGNLKLANRPSSEKERETHPKEKEKTLFETRGEAGYIVASPTQGYELIQGSFENIPLLSIQERDMLLSVARSFSQVIKEYTPPKYKTDFSFTGLSPFQDYNQRGDVVGLLQKHGWTFVNTKAAKTFLKRPGDTKATQSANFDSDKNWFTCFSSSTEFETQKAYQPYAVYAVLECNGDYSLAAKKLYEEGYGERRTQSNTGYDKFFKDNFSNSTIDPDFNGNDYLISSIDLLKLDVEEERYLLSPIVPRIGTGVLAGSPDAGKSQLARQFCIAIATGMKTFLGYDLTLVNKRALYIATEDDAHNTSFLLKKQLEGLSQTATDNLKFVFADTLSQEEILKTLDIHLSKNPCDLVVVDSFGDIFQGADSNNTILMRKNVRAFDYFAKKHKCFILFVHHINKSSYNETPHQKNIMGGGGLTQKVRFAWQLTQAEGETKYLTVVKGNYCPREYKENSWVLSFSETNFTFTNTSVKLPTASINLDNGKAKDTKFDKLKTMADEIFNNQSLRNGQFVKRHNEVTGKGIAQAKRDLKAMYDFEIVIKDDNLYSLNGSVNNMEAPPDPDSEEPPF